MVKIKLSNFWILIYFNKHEHDEINKLIIHYIDNNNILLYLHNINNFKHDEKYNNDNCCICLESINNKYFDKIVLKCGHSFHFDCLKKQIESKNYECGLCKNFIS